MRMVLRLVGAGFLALAMILLVGDGRAMLANSAFFATPLAETIGQFFPGTLHAGRTVIQENVHPLLWDPALTTLLAWPGWAVFGVLGAVLALLGRGRTRRRLVAIDQY